MKRILMLMLLLPLLAGGQVVCPPESVHDAVEKRVCEPDFLKYYDSITDDNLAAFIDQWAAWSATWGQSHSNPICDSVYQMFRAPPSAGQANIVFHTADKKDAQRLSGSE